ncbi:MAG TPA: hypothetical protein VNA25_28320 [Phycisphaerae bacterium]|nr:hypothetical protein [Phycisphaerae bacterium]
MRRDEGDIGFGGPEPSRDEEQQQPEQLGIIDRAKTKIAAHQSKRIHDLAGGRICTHAVFERIQAGHEFLGREAYLLVRESPGGSMERWRRWSKRTDPPVASIPPADLRLVMREYTLLPAGEDRPSDQVFMIDGSNVTIIGHTPSKALLDRIAAFEGLDPKEEQPTQKDRAVS